MKKILIGLIFSLVFSFAYAEDVSLIKEPKDETPPVITLIGDEIVSIDVGSEYVEAGATALDDVDGNVSSSILITPITINTEVAGTYYVTYTVSDLSGNQSEIKREINVSIPTPTLSSISVTTGANKLDYYVGEELDITGLVVTGTYSDGSTKVEEITDQNVSGFNSSVPVIGQELIIKIGEITATYLVNIKEKVEESNGNDSDFLARGSIVLSDNCSVNDLDGDTHLFPQEGSPSKYLGICALRDAQVEGIVDDFEMIEYSFGLFVDSINNIKDPTTSYWALYLNDEYEMRGLTTLPLKAGDKMSLVYVDFNDDFLGSRVDIMISELVSPQSPRGSSNGGQKEQISFSLSDAISFLENNHDTEMDIMYTDWVAIGVAGQSDILKNRIESYFKLNDFDFSSVTDYERHALALMSVGINPYDGTDFDYVKKIVSSFDGNQIGEKGLLNDDIFGLIVLSKSGYEKNDEIIKKVVFNLVDKQGSDGSYESIDMTAAAIQALSLFESLSGDAIKKAENYLLSQQKFDGSFGNVYSTAWVVQALSINHSDSEELNKAVDYLSSLQKEDGGFLDDSILNRVWATSYATPALLGLTFTDQVEDFEKSEEEVVLEVPEIVTKVIPEKIIVKKEIKPVFIETSISNPLTASALDSLEVVDNQSFIDSISNVLGGIRGFIAKVWHMLGF